MPKMLFECLDEEFMIPTMSELHLADSTVVYPYGISKKVLVTIHGTLTLVDFYVMDMNPR
jgi:predicted membrane-bound dolichyl-phosphate-mannose-protein mannosyltransferase